MAPARSRVRLVLLVLLAGSAALRVGFALRKGLVLDEFHSLFHARNALEGGFFASLLRDNHPPLSFLVIGGARNLFGESELALRSPAIVFGLAEIALVFALARRIVGPARALAAALLVAASSLHLDFSTQARMYALHALAATAALAGWVELARAPAERRARGAAWLVACGILVGFHNHYFTAQYVAGLGAAFLALAALVPEVRRRLRLLVLPAVVVIALSLPWLLTGFRAQLGHALPPGGDDQGFAGLAEALVHLFFLNIRLGGEILRPVYLAASVGMIAFAAIGFVSLVRAREARAAWILAVAAVGVPAGASFAAKWFPRAGFTWHYVLPSTAAMAILVSASLGPGALRRLRATLAAAVVLAVATLTIQNATSRGTEDFPGAVEHLISEWRPGDAVVSVEWQPALFPQGLPWDYYAPRVADDPPPRLAMREYAVADRDELRRAERVLLLRSKLPLDQTLMRWIGEDFAEESIERFGFGRFAHVFVRRSR